MIVSLIYHTDGVTLTVKPRNGRDRFPDNYRLKKDEKGNLSIYGTGLPKDGMNLGKIPDGYELHKQTKYEIVYKTGVKRNIRSRRKAK